MKIKWLDRAILYSPYICLCLTQKEFDKANKHLGCVLVKFPAKHGTCTTYVRKSGVTCVVCLNNVIGLHLSVIAGIITHEATHVWQEALLKMGERNPGDETEAYAIQHITQTLFDRFLDRVAVRNNRVKRIK